MKKGQYERTPLTKARLRLTQTERRIERHLAKIAEDEVLKQELENEIKELEKEESK